MKYKLVFGYQDALGGYHTDHHTPLFLSIDDAKDWVSVKLSIATQVKSWWAWVFYDRQLVYVSSSKEDLRYRKVPAYDLVKQRVLAVQKVEQQTSSKVKTAGWLERFDRLGDHLSTSLQWIETALQTHSTL